VDVTTNKESPAVREAERPDEIEDDHFGLERLVFFSDAVFAIAITLLALEIRLPDLPAPVSNEDLLAALLDLAPKYLSYVVSFLVIGLYWMTHHRRFRFIYRYDRTLLWLNLILLMFVAFIPFPTSVLSEYGNRTATVFYALVITLSGAMSWAIWSHAVRGRRLVHPDLTDEVIRGERYRMLVTPAIFLFSIPVAFINDDLAKFMWGLPLFASLFDRSILHRRRPAKKSPEKST
jgi:uncharacterized membrane protein